jgi:hypothetical protein
MACNAVLEPWIGHIMRRGLCDNSVSLPPKFIRTVVTLQTDGEHDRAPEQTGIHRAVGTMASFATLYPDRRVLKDERPSFVGVALETSLLIAERLIHHAGPQSHAPGCSRRTMRIMAIRALDDALIYPVFERHRKLSPDRSVTGITEVGLLLCQKEFRCCGLVDRMAVTTDHIA